MRISWKEIVNIKRGVVIHVFLHLRSKNINLLAFCLFFPLDTHFVTLPPSLSHTFSFFSSRGVIWTIWRMRRGRRASTMSTASSRPSSSPSRQRPPLATATASSPTSVQWAPCCCCCKPYWAQWSTPSWWAPELVHDWEVGKSSVVSNSKNSDYSVAIMYCD